MLQNAKGVAAWSNPFLPLRVPALFNLRSDPLEKGDESIYYQKWMADRMFTMVPAQAMVAEFLKTFQEFPPRQKPASFSIDQALEKARETQKQMVAAPTAAAPAARKRELATAS